MRKLLSGFLFLLAFTLLPLTGCNNQEEYEQAIPTPITDSYKMDFDFDGLDFLKDGIAEVSVYNIVDGDTGNFDPIDSNNPNDRINIRFLGINTPEATGIVQPWGKPASVWVSNVLTSAHRVVLINDLVSIDQKDNVGRYLAFIWYQPKVNADWRLLNLEVIEQCYSGFNPFGSSDMCPYADPMLQAELYARSSKRRIWGEQDPGYDYSNHVYEPNIRSIREQYDAFGMSNTSGSSGKFLQMTLVVVGMSGNNLFLRDLYNPYATGEYASIYAYAGYGASLLNGNERVTPGAVVRFYCRASEFHGSIQLTDIQDSIRYPFEILLGYEKPGINSTKTIKEMLVDGEPGDELIEELEEIRKSIGVESDLVYTYKPYDRTNDFKDVTSVEQMSSHNGLFVETYINVRSFVDGEDQEKGEFTTSDRHIKIDSDSKDAIIYASPAYYDNVSGEYLENSKVSLNLRAIYDTGTNYSVFLFGNIVKVKAYLTIYDGKAQLILNNNSLWGPCYPYLEVIN